MSLFDKADIKAYIACENLEKACSQDLLSALGIISNFDGKTIEELEKLASTRDTEPGGDPFKREYTYAENGISYTYKFGSNYMSQTVNQGTNGSEGHKLSIESEDGHLKSFDFKSAKEQLKLTAEPSGQSVKFVVDSQSRNIFAKQFPPLVNSSHVNKLIESKEGSTLVFWDNYAQTVKA